ncbi:putative BspA family leucine-rich repeat surface protein [Aeromonas phage LAh10]|uniref:Putative BspA family leucine-rich repeat surface protein n=1 Tax=Aeromonas phage LAh10 TaxID=2591025 RepID=A0A514A155_9CAUD|nr:putative BspA family leucine-rich repeat surface protein [Aeromonas phage LAh10]QDH47009.1 putative BspA family leucine-rich repeat surface protein [Aeromonas phage LAh10]
MYVDKDKPQPPLDERTDPVGVVLEAFIENDRKVQEVTGDIVDTIKDIQNAQASATQKLDKFDADVKAKLKTHVDKRGAVHGENKHTVGLGNKDNYPMATMQEHVDGKALAYAHPSGLRELVESRVKSDPTKYIPARVIPLASGGMLGDIPQYHMDLSIGELDQSKQDPNLHLGETPWEFSTTSGALIFPTINNAPHHGRYTQVPQGMNVFSHGPHGGTKIRVYNKTLDSRRTRPSFIRGWGDTSGAPEQLGTCVKTGSSLFDKTHVIYRENNWLLRSFNKNALPSDVIEIYKHYSKEPEGIFEYAEGFLFNYWVTPLNAIVPGGSVAEPHIKLDMRCFKMDVADYRAAQGAVSLNGEQRTTLGDTTQTFSATVPAHNKMVFGGQAGSGIGSIYIRLNRLLSLPAGMENAFLANLNQNLVRQLTFAWRNRMSYHGLFRIPVGWWNKQKTKYWHAWVDFEIIDRPFYTGLNNQLRVLTADPSWNAVQTVDANWNVTGSGMFKEYRADIKDNPMHPLALGGIFESQGGHMKTYTLYGRQYTAYHQHDMGQSLDFITKGNAPLPPPTQSEYSARSTLNGTGLYGDHLRHIPVDIDQQTGLVTYLTHVRDYRDRYRWARVVIDGEQEVVQDRFYGNYLGPKVQKLDWLPGIKTPRPFVISNDDFQPTMNINGLVFTAENKFLGFGSFRTNEANQDYLEYVDEIRLDEQVIAWVKSNAGGFTNPDLLFFYFRGSLFWFCRCSDPGEYPADGKDCYYGVIKDCGVKLDGGGARVMGPNGSIADSITINKFNLMTKNSLLVDQAEVYGIDSLSGRDVYIMMTQHHNDSGTQDHDVMVNMGPFNNFYIEMKLIRSGDGAMTFRPKPEAIDPVFPYTESNGFQIDYDAHTLYGTKIPERFHVNYQSPVMLKKGMWSYRKTPNNFGFFTRRHGFITITGCVMASYYGTDVYPMGSVLTVSGKNTVVKKPVQFSPDDIDGSSELFVRIVGDEPVLYGTNFNPNGYEVEPHNGAAPAGWGSGSNFYYYDPASWRNTFMPVIDGRRMSWYGYGSTVPVLLGKPGEGLPINRYYFGTQSTQMTWDTAKGRVVKFDTEIATTVAVNGNAEVTGSATQYVIPAQYTGVVTIDLYNANKLIWAPGLTNLIRLGSEIMEVDFSGSDQFTISAPLPKRVTSLKRAFYKAKGASYPGLQNWNVTGVTDFTECFAETTAFNQDLSNWTFVMGRTLRGMFQNAVAFNQPVPGTWFQYILDCSYMFAGSGAFNKPLTGTALQCKTAIGMFQGSKVFNSSINGLKFLEIVDISDFFRESVVFNQSINGFDVSKVERAERMFQGAKGFLQPITLNMKQCHSVSGMFKDNLVFNALVNISLPICTDFSQMFMGTKLFNQKLPEWSFSPRTTLLEMFRGSEAYNQSMDHWMMERVASVRGMFRDAVAFNTPVKTWKFYKLRDCAYLFAAPNFNADVNDIQWPNDKTLDIDAGGIFYGALVFNKPLNKWNVSAFGQLNGMFNNAPVFNQDISMWDTSNCWRMANLFLRATAFSGDISKWDVSKVIDFSQFAANAINFKSDLSKWKVSACLNFNRMFRHALAFNSPIGDWDVSNGVDFESMFDAYHITETVTEPSYAMTFNQDISKWNVGKGVKFNAMFRKCESFNQDISNWNMANAEETGAMFQNCYLFNADLSKWNPGRLMNIKYMFYKAISFNRSIGHWDVSRCTEFTQVFLGAIEFNQNLNNWNVSNGTDFKGMFENAVKFNGTIGGWDVRKGVAFNRMFWHCFALDQDISAWRVDSGQNFQDMFRDCYYYNSPMNDWGMGNAITCTDMFTGCLTFNQPLDKWNTSRVTSMQAMFYKTPKFNQNLNSWTTSSVLNMANMFKGANVYNQPMDKWDVSKVTDFTNMFGPIADTDPYAFNQPLATWNTASAVNMTAMFRMCWNFNQKLTGWNTSKVTNMTAMFYRCERLVDPDVNGWDVSKVQSFQSMFQGCPLFYGSLFAWRPVEARNMSEMFRDAVKFNSNISSWNMTKVGTFAGMFQGARAFNQDISSWNTNAATDMSNMFFGAVAFNAPIGSWNTGNVNDMADMFHGATAFNKPIGNWNVSNVTAMNGMFTEATAFAQDISGWNVGKVANFNSMFRAALNFNSPVNDWNVSSATQMGSMFKGCPKFNQPLNKWDVSKVTNFGYMFDGWEDYPNGTTVYDMIFNQDLSMWNVSAGTTFHYMFRNCTAYNQSMANWKVGNATTMVAMFSNCKELTDPGIGIWDVRKVTLANYMFASCYKFNSNIAPWSTLVCTNMDSMFENAKLFNQDLSGWNVAKVTTHTNFDTGATAWTKPRPNFV